jgi:glucokinase
MKILAADVGGTNARFAAVEIRDLDSISMGEAFIFPTDADGVNSLNDLLRYFAKHAPEEIADLAAYDRIAIGVAGAVVGHTATLPNISWDIDLDSVDPSLTVLLLNDFHAQASAFLDPALVGRLQLVRPGPGFGPGSVAILGAGTGLGHATVLPYRDRFIVVPSEAGHATFCFQGDREKEIERFFITRKGKSWISNDDVVSGSGAALLHEFLCGEVCSPAQALSRFSPHPETARFFARFYARVCRNYCLTMHPVERLIISGGIAAKNPHLLECDEFLQEFNDAVHYRHLVERIPIFLNRDQGIGIRGAAIHAWLRC